MKNKLLCIAMLFIANFSVAQYCTPTYSSGSGSGDFIQSVNFLTINNTTNADPAPYYTYYNSGYTVPTLTIGSTYSGTITAGTYVPISSSETFHIWIDFNQDGDFSDSGEDIGEYYTTLAGQIVNFSVTVPATALTGQTRMRILTAFNVANTSPCGAFAFGECEDYNVNISGGSSTYCIPTYSVGTSSGDYIQQIQLAGVTAVTGPNSSAPYYSDYTANTAWQPILIPGNNYVLNITSGTYSNDNYAAWIDYNNDGDFNDANEYLGLVSSTLANQTLSLNFVVPSGLTTGNLTMRVRCSYSTNPMDPCAAYTYGETEDYTVKIQSNTAVYCIPNPSSGTTGGDYINGVSLGTINNQNTGSTTGPNYNDYTYLSTALSTNTSYVINIQSGLYSTDYYAVWIDYNQDGDFNDAGEKLGEVQSSSGFQNLSINFTVPGTALIGSTTMRVRCVFGTPSMDPCTNYTYGETEDYTVNISTGGGTVPYCQTNLHGVGCISSDAIDDVYLLNSTLMNLGTGCNGLDGLGYTLWPASGSTTGTLLRNQTYILGVTTTSQSIISAWFDWNGDGTFSASEWYQVATSSTPNTTSQINITVPNNAVIGQTRMRVRSRLAGNNNGPTDPCTLFLSGETEDYTITISNATCIPPVAYFGGEYISGVTFNFYDYSANFPTSWSWSFQGATPSTSTLQDPTGISYNVNGGCYDVTLTVTNACGSNTFTRPCYVNVGATTACDELFFSEYIEGTGSNKALEIYNASSTAKNLSGYSVQTYSNGSPTATYSLNLSGTIASHDVYVITNAGASLSGIINNSDVTSNVTFFDGNDAIVLKKNGIVIDKIGNLGEDPGFAWQVGSGSTAEFTLVRKNTVDRPNTYWPDAQNEWDVFAQNTTTYLGSHSSICGTGAAPVANFIGNPLNITVGQTVNFTDLSSNSPTSWTWQFSGGVPATSTVQNPTNIQYNTPGCYQVTLSVANAFGNDSKTVTCYVNVSSAILPPVAAFTANTFNITTGQTVNFTDLSTNSPSSWSWSFQGATPATSTLQHPSNIQYNTPGCYQVTLTASNSAGSDTETQTCYINVVNQGSGPLANFTASNTAICVGSCISFTDASSNNPTAWNWSFPGASVTSSIVQNPSNICYNTPGTYNVSLTAINANGSNTLTLNGYITVYDMPIANAGANQTICLGSSVQLNASGGQSYSWSPATGLSSTTIANPIASPSTTTTYTVQVTNGTCSSIASVVVTVNTLNIDAGNDVTICSGASTQLNATGGTTYSWSPVVGLNNPNISNPLAFPSSTTTYTVTATSNGCTATDQVTVTVASPTISAGPDLEICEGQSVQLSVNGGSNYSWSPATGLDNPNISNPIASPNSTTSYTVTGTVAGCSASDVILVTVNANPTVPIISPSGIEIQSTVADAYQWNLNGNPILGATLQSLFPDTPGDYTVTVYNSNGCSSTSAPYTVTTVGLTTKKLDNTLSIFPNPVANNCLITIQANQNDEAVILFYNSLGQIVLEQPLNLVNGKNSININVENLAAGVYNIKLVGTHISATQPLIKK